MAACPLASGVTLLIVLLMFATAALVGAARRSEGIRAPAVAGSEVFERAYRIQMNTLEWAVMLLPCLWIFAAYLSDAWAAALGGVWLAARIRYVIVYRRAPERRGSAFMVAALAFGALGLGAGFGVLRQLFAS